MRRLLPALMTALLVLPLLHGCTGRAQGEKPQTLAKMPIQIAGQSLPVEIACTSEQRQMGMMYRRKLAVDEGMLFVFERERPLAFYMKNTYAPLSIAFLNANGQVVNIAHMEPLTLKTHESRLPSQYALEMPQGWFEKHGVREGDTIGLPKIDGNTD